MPHLPLNIDVRGMSVLVVGGGGVAGRKIKSLLDAEATVTVVAPELSPEIARLAATGAINSKNGFYQAADLTDVFLAVAATNDPGTNRRIAADARRRGIPTLILFKGGVVVDQIVGAVPKSQLDALLAKAL